MSINTDIPQFAICKSNELFILSSGNDFRITISKQMQIAILSSLNLEKIHIPLKSWLPNIYKKLVTLPKNQQVTLNLLSNG